MQLSDPCQKTDATPHDGRMKRSRLGVGKGRCRARCQGTERSTPTAQEWEARYLHGRTSWDIGAAQPEFLQLAKAGAFQGRVLDVGCGTGEHALLAARIGLAATGIDVSRPSGLFKLPTRHHSSDGLTSGR
jgi:2-polyprenyl-3-methyl-5-hydroxy-6-metoxy-1,4-benzoquinol methylase